MTCTETDIEAVEHLDFPLLCNNDECGDKPETAQPAVQFIRLIFPCCTSLDPICAQHSRQARHEKLWHR